MKIAFSFDPLHAFWKVPTKQQNDVFDEQA
jgi:hypothetical protein